MRKILSISGYIQLISSILLLLQANKLIELFSKVILTGEQLGVSLASDMNQHLWQLRRESCACITQLLLPIGPVPDLFQAVVNPFRSIAHSSGIRCTGMQATLA